MLLLQKHVLLLSLRPRATSALLSFRHRCLLSNTRFAATATVAAAAALAASASPAPFAVEDYLVASCHLTPAQAVKASKVLSRLKSPSKPEAVLAFLSDLGLSDADVAAVVVYDPLLLCSEVDKTLVPRLTELRDLGLSPSQIARLVLVDPARFRRPTIISKLQYYVPLFGSFENLLQAFKYNSHLLTPQLRPGERCQAQLRAPQLRPGERCLAQRCAPPGLRYCQAMHPCAERIQAMVARAQDVGVPHGSAMSRHALLAVAFLSEEKIAAKVEFLKKTFRWSEEEVAIAIAKLPVVLRN